MSFLRLSDRKSLTASLSLAALFVITLAIYGRSAFDRVDELLHGRQLVQGTFYPSLTSLQVDGLEPKAEQAGLRLHDRVLAVNGKPTQGITDIYSAFRTARQGDSLLIRVARTRNAANDVLVVAVPLVPFTYFGYLPYTAAYILSITVRLATPLLCLVLGFSVAIIRRNDRCAWALLFLLLGVANFITDDITIAGHQGVIHAILTAFVSLFIGIGPLALFYFVVIFPHPLTPDRKLPFVKWLILGPLIAHATVQAFVFSILLHQHEAMPALWAGLNKVGDVVDRLDVLLICTSFLVLLVRTFQARDRDERRRLVLLDIGAALGLLPCIGLLTWAVLHHVRFTGLPAVLCVAAMVLFPLTMAYVIVVHRAMDVRVVLRTGVQYLLATGGVRALQFIVATSIVVAAATVTTSGSLWTRMVLIGAGFGCLTLLGTFAERLRCAIDRRFFRDAYETDEILADLANQVRTVVETRPLLELVGSRIREALHVPQVAILLDGGGAFRPAFAAGYSDMPAAVLLPGSLTVRRVQQTSHTLVKFGQAESWVQLTDPSERAVLQELGSELLLPLSLKEKLLGFMSLGPKQSEEPFSPTDLRLLQSVAAQTGLALENGRLTDQIKEEARIREKQARELELGREVQERLFPQDYPAIPGLDYAGACRPALGVGGDYYDFLPLPDGGLGVAIGDVSGKGISAALLMATLRAFLRGQTLDTEMDLGSALQQLNHLVYGSSAANKYATFFLGVLHPETRVFRFVNAGHNAPIVLCASGEVQRLEAGGCVVGLLPTGIWESGEVRLERGDLLVMYTDGVSEAMDGADEEWGEDRLIESVKAARFHKADSILQSLMSAADTFVAGAPQWDDMTLIVARVQ